jgi:hypothetical protein
MDSSRAFRFSDGVADVQVPVLLNDEFELIQSRPVRAIGARSLFKSVRSPVAAREGFVGDDAVVFGIILLTYA